MQEENPVFNIENHKVEEFEIILKFEEMAILSKSVIHHEKILFWCVADISYKIIDIVLEYFTNSAFKFILIKSFI